MTMTALTVGAGLLAWVATNAKPPDARLPAGSHAGAEVLVSVTVVDHSLAATEAIADFGIAKGIRLVRVRIADVMRLRLRIESSETLKLAEPPRLCLFWEFAAPDDAGLENRCWGQPDLRDVVAAQLERNAAGQLELVAGHPLEIAAELQRGDVRCDYPPGVWDLETTLVPLVESKQQEPIDLPPVTFEVPAGGDGPLPFLQFNTRFCGLATTVYIHQGEPQVAVP